MRKLSHLMDPDFIFDENYNYQASNKLFQRQNHPSNKETAINMTNKILKQCLKSSTNPTLFLDKSSSGSENQEFCSENQTFFKQESNKSKSEEFSIASMPAKLENIDGYDDRLNLHVNFDNLRNFENMEKTTQNDINSPTVIEKTLESSFRNDVSEINERPQENSSKYTQKDHALHELQLKDAILRQNLSKMRKCIEELKQDLDDQKKKNEALLKGREKVDYYKNICKIIEKITKDALYIKKANKEIQNYENSMKKIKRENQEVKARNIELELVLKEILFEKEYQKNVTPQKNNNTNKPLQNITNCPRNQNMFNK